MFHKNRMRPCERTKHPGVEGGGTKRMLGYMAGAPKPWPCLRQKSLIFYSVLDPIYIFETTSKNIYPGAPKIFI